MNEWTNNWIWLNDPCFQIALSKNEWLFIFTGLDYYNSCIKFPFLYLNFHRIIKKMYQKFFNRRFERNTKLLSPPSIDMANRNYSASKEFASTSNCEDSEDQKWMMNKDLKR